MSSVRFNRSVLVRFVQFGWRRQLLAGEALAALAVASAAIRFLPFRYSVRLGGRSVRPGSSDVEQVARETRWAIEAVAKRVPWRAVCFQQGLALQWMLRRRGVEARLHYGLGRNPSGGPEAHVWISSGETIVIGASEAPRFRCVARFP